MHIPRTPIEINGYPVIALVRLPQRDGYLPDAHVVVCERVSIAHATTYMVWNVCWLRVNPDAAGHWEADHGRYDLASIDRALLIMCQRASDRFGS